MEEVTISTDNFSPSSQGQDVETLVNSSQFVTAIETNSTNFLLTLYFNGTELHLNETNATYIIQADWKSAYKPLLDILLLAVLTTVMLAMGCELTWENLLQHIKKPIGFLIGIFSQFGIMPLCAFCLLTVTGIEGLHATGVLIISCCPGGVLSNFFTYFCDGNLALSMTMTSISTLIAMGMMPFNMWLYGRHFESRDLMIPYAKMAMSMVTVTSPAIIGMLIKWKFPRVAPFLTKIGSYLSMVIVVICVGMEVFIFPNMFSDVSFKVYAIILTLPAIGMILGYGLATILKQDRPTKKTISIECGVQNCPIALTVIALSFPIEMQEQLVLLPWLYLFSMSLASSVICLGYNLWKKFFQKPDIQSDVVVKQDPLLKAGDQVQCMNATEIKLIPRIMKDGKEITNSTSCV